MPTILFHVTGKPGSESQMRALLVEMTRVSREEDRALHYTFHQQKNDARQWMLYERWRDREHLLAHQANMKRHFGEPPAGAQLPARLHELTESFSATFYSVVA